MNWEEWINKVNELISSVTDETIEEKRKAVIRWAGEQGFFPDNGAIKRLEKGLIKVEIEQQGALILGILQGLSLLVRTLVKEKIEKIERGM